MDDQEAITADDTVIAEFAAMGAVVADGAVPATSDFDVWPENWDSLSAWLSVETQWRAVSNKDHLIWLGLDYAAVDIVLRRRQLSDRVFSDLQLMEREALNTFAEASS